MLMSFPMAHCAGGEVRSPHSTPDEEAQEIETCERMDGWRAEIKRSAFEGGRVESRLSQLPLGLVQQ